MIYKSIRGGTIFNFTMDVDPGFENNRKFKRGISWYMIETIDVISRISFKLRNENNELVSFNGQSISFGLSIKEILLEIYLQLFEYFLQLYLYLHHPNAENIEKMKITF